MKPPPKVCHGMSVGRFSSGEKIIASDSDLKTWLFKEITKNSLKEDTLHPRSLTWTLKSHYLKDKYVFQPSFFRGYVKLHGYKVLGFKAA